MHNREFVPITEFGVREDGSYQNMCRACYKSIRLHRPLTAEFTITNDPLVVNTKLVANHINAWVANHPEPERNGADHYGNLVLGPIQILANFSKLSPRAINRVINLETKFTSFAIVDKIATAMGKPYLVSEGEELAPVPNPNWSQERWMMWRSMYSCSDD